MELEALFNTKLFFVFSRTSPKARMGRQGQKRFTWSFQPSTRHYYYNHGVTTK